MLAVSIFADSSDDTLSFSGVKEVSGYTANPENALSNLDGCCHIYVSYRKAKELVRKYGMSHEDQCRMLQYSNIT